MVKYKTEEDIKVPDFETKFQLIIIMIIIANAYYLYSISGTILSTYMNYLISSCSKLVR